jgi:dTDP-3-amino-3,4,6-trideoxy-alpha-D-glucose transaminase
MAVPLFATEAALSSLRPEVGQRIQAVLDSGRYILGEEGEAFEAEFAAYLGAAHCVGVANGTDALMIALLALGVRSGDEVVVPAVSFFATAEAVAALGARPVFADVEDDLWCVSAASVERVLTRRSRAIVPVHLFGNPAPMREILDLAEARGIPVLEDAAQAAGAQLCGGKAGTHGHAAAFSFYPGKNLGGVGDGGAVVTDDPEIAALARRLRNHGSADRRTHTEVGYNSRLDEIQAAALRVHLRHLDRWTAARRDAVSQYEAKGLGELVGMPLQTAEAESCYHLFVVTTPERDQLQRDLAEAGIETRVYYTPVLPEQPALRAYGPQAPTPAAESYAGTALALPIGPSLSERQIRHVVATARASLA